MQRERLFYRRNFCVQVTNLNLQRRELKKEKERMAEKAEEIKGEGFTIIDKRRRPEDQSEGSSDKASETEKAEEKPAEGKNSLPVDDSFREVDFSSFIFSLSTSALIHLGSIQNPISKKTEKNLPLAKQTIDLLGILQDKTKGNLTKEEEEFLNNILYDLRMRYVKESKVK